MFTELFVCIDYCNKIWVILTHYSSYIYIHTNNIYLYVYPPSEAQFTCTLECITVFHVFCDCFLFQSCRCVPQIHFYRPICWALYGFSFLISMTGLSMVIGGRMVWVQKSENAHGSGDALRGFSLCTTIHWCMNLQALPGFPLPLSSHLENEKINHAWDPQPEN